MNDQVLTLGDIYRLAHDRWGYSYPTVRKALDRHKIPLEPNPLNHKQLQTTFAAVEPLIVAREGKLTRAEAANLLGISDRVNNVQARILANLARKYNLQISPDPWNENNRLYNVAEIGAIVDKRGHARPYRKQRHPHVAESVAEPHAQTA